MAFKVPRLAAVAAQCFFKAGGKCKSFRHEAPVSCLSSMAQTPGIDISSQLSFQCREEQLFSVSQIHSLPHESSHQMASYVRSSTMSSLASTPEVSGTTAYDYGQRTPGGNPLGGVDPFSLVSDELAMLGEKMRKMVVTEVPKLATAAEYFFKVGAQGKRFRPAILLLMASSLTESSHQTLEHQGHELRQRQQRLAEITEMIHVASLLHDDVLDHADTRRGVGSLNYMMGNKLAVLAGDFLLARASVALASLRNTEVVELLSNVLEHLVTGEIMQMVAEPGQHCSMDYYLKKNFYKTASLLANSCKAIAILGHQPPEVAHSAFLYGQHLGQAFQLVDDALDFTGSLISLGKPSLSDLRQGLATAPVLFAAEQHQGMIDLIHRKFSRSGDVEQALAWVRLSRGIEQTHALAAEHAALAENAILSLPSTSSDTAKLCRQGLIDLTSRVLTRRN